MDLKSTYNKIANDWFKDHKGDMWWHEGTNKFLSLIPKNGLILDIGCGTGVKSKYLSDEGFKVVGMDFSENMIGIAKKEVPEVDFIVGDIYDLDLYQNKFDAVFAQAVLLHIPKEKVIRVLEKFKNKLNPNGVLYLAVKEMKTNGVDSEILRENDYGYEYERFFSYFNLSEICEYIEKVGLELISKEVISSGNTNWIQIIAKNII